MPFDPLLRALLDLIDEPGHRPHEPADLPEHQREAPARDPAVVDVAQHRAIDFDVVDALPLDRVEAQRTEPVTASGDHHLPLDLTQRQPDGQLTLASEDLPQPADEPLVRDPGPSHEITPDDRLKQTLVPLNRQPGQA